MCFFRKKSYLRTRFTAYQKRKYATFDLPKTGDGYWQGITITYLLRATVIPLLSKMVMEQLMILMVSDPTKSA